MVEAIVVISVFILFFVGMVYFESLYHEHLRVYQLARAATVAYAMDACNDSDPLQAVRKDLGTASGGNNPSPQQSSPAKINTPNATVGNGQGDPLGSSMQSRGFDGDKIADIKVTGKAGGSTQNGAFSPRWGFHSDVKSDSFMSCGDKQEQGSASAIVDQVKGLLGDNN